MTHTADEIFRYSAEITKAEQDDKGDWVFDAVASLPGKDLQGEQVDPMGLETDYFFGKGLPKSGGFINFDHDPTTIVGVPLEGKLSPSGFRLKWKGLKTKFMEKIVDQMRAMKEGGDLRRYGMSIEGIVKERDEEDPSKIKRAFIRNVALTPTPVHPGTFVEFAKSLTAASVVRFDPAYGQAAAIRTWVDTLADIATGRVPIRRNRYFRADGRFRRDRDVAYFQDVHGLPEGAALSLARYVLSRQDAVLKALTAADGAPLIPQSLNDPYHATLHHLQKWRATHPTDPHISAGGNIVGGDRAVAQHFLVCEKRPRREVEAIVRLLHDTSVLDPENAL